MSLFVFRDILDKQLIDSHGCRMGRVDGIVGRVRDGAPPVIEGIELGMIRVAERLHRPWGRTGESLSRRMGVRRIPRFVLPWSKVKSVDGHQIEVTVDNESEASNDWEWWLRTHVIDRIPGGKPEEEEK